MARDSKSGSRRRDSGGGRGDRGRSGGGRSRRPPTNRQFPRTARLNSLLQEIVADFFERIDDDRFDLITIAGVEVDSDLNKARVFISDPDLMSGSGLSSGSEADLGGGDDAGSADRDEELLAALGEYRRAVQSKIGRETRIRKTPEVVFEVDPGIRSGARIDAILSTLETTPPDSDADLGGHGDGPVNGDRSEEAGS